MEALFIPGGGAQRLFAVFHPAKGAPRGSVLLLPPWGEEMHKCRHVFASTARELAARGWQVLSVDLTGTGDAEGDFGEASWAGWLSDARAARDWLLARSGGHLWLWGVRTGALLAGELARERAVDGLLLWQPVSAGKLFLTQQLRLKLAGDLAAEGGMKLDTGPLLAALRQGETIEIAGYRHAPELLLPLENLVLDVAAGDARRVLWCELGGREPPSLLPASVRVIERWQAAGLAVQAQAFNGPAFWQTTELERCPALEAFSVAEVAT